MLLVDSHCHLDYKGLVEKQQAVLERARERGVDRHAQHCDTRKRMGPGDGHRRARGRCLGHGGHSST